MLAAVFAPACTLPNPAFDETETEGQTELAGDGDGDGDGDTVGDGDGAPSDTQPGDGDGDSDTGDMCPPGFEDCDGECIALDEDPLNCGSCGFACQPSYLCDAGDCVNPKGIPRAVFVSSKWHTGDFGGLEGANTACSKMASEANLEGDFKAWLGVGQSGPAVTFTQHGYFVLVDGTVIAESWADLTDGELLAPISLNEFGQQGTGPFGCNGQSSVVWTGVSPKGETLVANCSGWTVAEGEAGIGFLKATDSAWTMAPMCGAGCGQALPMYCFAQ